MGTARTKLAVLVATATSLIAAFAWWGASPATGSTSSHTYTIGVLADVTGLAANTDTVPGIEAGVHLANQEGYHFKLDVVDTATSPATIQAGAQKLVLQDHVNAVIAISALTDVAAPFLTSHGVPVVGFALDGSEWLTAPNMFSPDGYNDLTKVSTTIGKLMKMEGGTNLGDVGYAIGLSANAADGFAASVRNAGLKVGYLNTNFPLGSTNVAPAAIAMKAAGVDSFIAVTAPVTGFAFITALNQDGVKLKAPIFQSGYGSDLTAAGPGAEQAAQDGYFTIYNEPVEMHTPATEQFQKNLAAVGVHGEPGVDHYLGYTAVALLTQGFKGAPPIPPIPS